MFYLEPNRLWNTYDKERVFITSAPLTHGKKVWYVKCLNKKQGAAVKGTPGVVHLRGTPGVVHLRNLARKYQVLLDTINYQVLLDTINC